MGSSCRSARILIVEDVSVVARNLSRRVKGFGYDVCAVTDLGEEAIHLAALHSPDLVLMDIQLKGALDGISAAEQIRSLHIPVVFLTAHTDEQVLRAAHACAPYAYVVKPYAPRELQIVIEMALYKHAAERERARLEAQASRSRKLDALGQLAGGIAHDFNNVLQVILTTCGVVAREVSDPQTQNRIALIRAAAERAARMTRQLLVFGREQAQTPVVPDPAQLIRSMVPLLSQLIGEDVAITMELDADLHPMRAMPWQIEQVLLNLVTNARDAMPTGGTISITGTNTRTGPDAGEHVLITVCDTGNGIDHETKTRIFEPYFTTKSAASGTGIGLATVNALVHEAGGKVEVVSALGKGTAFMIWIPAAEMPREEATRSEVTHLPALSGSILVVEDDAIVRMLIRDILEAAGAAVLVASDGEDALSVSRSHTGPIDVVVSDLVMPRMSGPELSHQLAIERPTTKIVYMSGYPDQSVPGGRASVVDRVLAKPFSPVQLLGVIREALA